ncbi:unnamed protein product [Orchesella dallaii]
MGREKRGPLALEAWARQLTDGYPHVAVNNMTTSWRNGLAFCALIHRFRPDLIDYDKLDPSDIIGNCSLAFETAESKLGIPALLDPEDMAAHEVPDRLSVLTYVAQFYSLFKNAEKKSTMPTRRQKDDADLKTRSSDKSTTPNSEKTSSTNTTSSTTASSPFASSVSATKRRFELSELTDAERAKRSALLTPPPCSKCQNPVYISERTVFMKKLYHRKCFRCHGCDSMLNPHTADVSADGTHFFCLAKSCQLELLKLNRGSSKNSSINDSNDSFSLSPSTPIRTDPSLLVRNSNIVPTPSGLQVIDSKNGDNTRNGHENVAKSPNSPRSHHYRDSSKESKENVPQMKDTDVGVVSGSSDEKHGLGRVSRLTARFESVQQSEEDPNTIEHNTYHQHPPPHQRPRTPEQFDNSNNIQVKHKDNSGLSSNASIISSRPIEQVEPPSSSITGNTGSLFDKRDDIDKNATHSTSSSITRNGDDDDDVEMPSAVDMSKANYLSSNKNNDAVPEEHGSNEGINNSVSPVHNARSNWLRDQIEEKETEKDKNNLNESKNSNEEEPSSTVEIPTVIVSEEDVIQDNQIASDAISIEFKLDSEKKEEEREEKMQTEEENIGDSGISGIGMIDDVAALASSTKTEEIEEDTENIQMPSSIMNQGDCQEQSKDASQFSVEADNKLQEQEDTGTSSSSAIINIKSESDDDNLKDSEPEKPLSTTPESSTLNDQKLNHNDSQNPFEEDEPEEVEQESDTNKAKTELNQEQDPVAVEVEGDGNNATTESPESVETVSATAPSPHQVEIEPPVVSPPKNLTPTPRKKKKAPAPIPQKLQTPQEPTSSESDRPMPSPRTRSKLRDSTRSSSSLLLERTSSTLKQEYPEELNPFGDDDEVPPPQPSPIPKPRPKSNATTLTTVANPFEEDEDDDSTLSVTEVSHTTGESAETRGEVTPVATKGAEINNNGNKTPIVVPAKPPKPSPRTSTPQPYNPFEDEDDIGEYDDDKPTGLFARGSHDDTSSISSKTSDLSNTSGITGGYPSHQKSFNAGDISSLSGSAKLRSRKNRRAPLPPGMGPSSTPASANTSLNLSLSINDGHLATSPNPVCPPSPKKVIPVSPELKVIKNQANKAQYRKKRRAPPPRRRVEPLPEDQIKTELHDLEIKQKELERQGISLEGNIRQLMSQEEGDGETNLESGTSNSSEQLDEMIIQLWGIVNEKNDILRRQTELEYLRRSHRLEEMQAELEFQLRILMDTPEDQRLENHAQTEQSFLDELLKLVDERNEVVDWLDYYRQMDREEEMQVSKSINQFKSHTSGIAEMVSHLKLKTKKDKKGKEDKDKSKHSGSANTSSSSLKSSKSFKEEAQGSSSKQSKKKDKDKHSSGLGLFSTLRKKTSKKHSKTVVDEDKDVDESVVVVSK